MPTSQSPWTLPIVFLDCSTVFSSGFIFPFFLSPQLLWHVVVCVVEKTLDNFRTFFLRVFDGIAVYSPSSYDNARLALRLTESVWISKTVWAPAVFLLVEDLFRSSSVTVSRKRHTNNCARSWCCVTGRTYCPVVCSCARFRTCETLIGGISL